MTLFASQITNASSGGAFTLLRINGQVDTAVPTHYHARYYESFFCVKGRINLWANQELRALSPHDFGAFPTFQNHSFQLVEPDSELIGLIAPSGFDPFYLSISLPWSNPSQAPFAPDRGAKTGDQRALSEPTIYDYWAVNYTLNNELVNGTSDPSIPWHTGNNTLPSGDRPHPFYIANNWGPKYLHRQLGQVVAPRLTAEQAKGNYSMEISTVVIRHKLVNETIEAQEFDKAQVFVVLEGQLTMQMTGQTVKLGTGDMAFVPANTSFQYWSSVAFTKFYLGSNRPALSDKLIAQGKEWNYAVFPSYIG